MLNIDDSALVYHYLAGHGYNTGIPIEANLDQARKANELHEGKNISAAGTFIALLNHFGHKDEALNLTKSSMQQFNKPEDQEYLKGWLDYLEDEKLRESSLLGWYIYAWKHIEEDITYGAVTIGPPVVLLLIIFIVLILKKRRKHMRQSNSVNAPQ
jgi:hypothetical protein